MSFICININVRKPERSAANGHLIFQQLIDTINDTNMLYVFISRHLLITTPPMIFTSLPGVAVRVTGSETRGFVVH